MRNLIMTLLAFLLCGCIAYADDILEKARRVAGVSERSEKLPESEIWNPLSAAARRYVGPLESLPSARFRAGHYAPSSIASEENLWQTINAMQRELQISRPIVLASGVSMGDVNNWLRRFNTQLTLTASVYREKNNLMIGVNYTSDTRVLAAFLNPALEKQLTGEEEKVLKGCAYWIASNIQYGMPNVLKIRMVNDAIIDNTEYKLSCEKTADVVLRGKGKCAAYTTATQLLLNMLGIDSRYVIGDVSTSSRKHGWNLVDVNGEWYHLDTTWNDPSGYGYFLLSDEEMGIDHTWPTSAMKHVVEYPKTPKLSNAHFYTRLDYVERPEPAEPPFLPVDEDGSLYDSLLEALNQDQKESSAEQVQKNTDPDTLVSESVLILPGREKEKKPKKEQGFYSVSSVEELNDVLKHCAESLEGPEIKLKLGENYHLLRFRHGLRHSEILRYIRRYTYTSDKKKPDDGGAVITLSVEYWPHVRLIQAARDAGISKKLRQEEHVALAECRSIAEACGTVWKTRRQKIDDAYLQVISSIQWKPGDSTVVSAMKSRSSGSLGLAETLQVVYALMNIPSQLVHGRTAEALQAWNKVQHSGNRWYHAVAAEDAASDARHSFKLKWKSRSDAAMLKTHVWAAEETSPSPPAMETGTIREAARREVKRRVPDKSGR